MIAAGGGVIVMDRAASAAALPDLPAPVPRVQAPKAPAVPQLPSLPVPVPQPAPAPAPIPVPALPAPVPSVPSPTGPGAGPSAPDAIRPLPSAQIEQIVSAATPQSGESVSRNSSAGQGGAEGRRDRRSKSGRRSSSVHRLPYERRLRLVRELRGCLDRLPERQSNALILRYGVGALRRKPSRQAADALNVSVEAFRRIHRRGLRNLVIRARRTGCEHGGVSGETISAAIDVAWTAAVADQVGTTIAARSGGGSERSAVLGVSESGDEDALADLGGGSGNSDVAGEQEEAAPLFGGLPLDTNSSLFLALLAIVLAGATWVIMSFVRATR